ncbi:MAG: hypothetical protein JW866_02185 [Ignavibacteriales bacterium]|nr:hypothetical protein [Ignavibacteriales bacterium]
MDKQKLAIFVICIIGAIATFLPWATVLEQPSYNGTNLSYGWIPIILFAGIGALVLFGDKKKALNGLYKILIMLVGAVNAVIGILKIVNMRSELSEICKTDVKDPIFNNSISVGFGIWLVVICGLALVTVIFLIKQKKVEEVKTNSQ